MIEAVRGIVDPQDPDAEHKIDAIAGATITTRGVTDDDSLLAGAGRFRAVSGQVEPRSRVTKQSVANLTTRTRRPW